MMGGGCRLGRVLPFRSSKIAVVEGMRGVGQLGFWVHVCFIFGEDGFWFTYIVERDAC